MSTYVRVRDPAILAETLENARLSQRAIAERAEISPARLSQLAHGTKTLIALVNASALEDTLEVERGSLFIVDTRYDVIAPYLAADASPVRVNQTPIAV